ncbi:MAG TPA: hypothetical protein VH593_15275 [Ktedonobacteraceae bacterium]
MEKRLHEYPISSAHEPEKTDAELVQLARQDHLGIPLWGPSFIGSRFIQIHPDGTHGDQSG